jgi:hypothetical protein
MGTRRTTRFARRCREVRGRRPFGADEEISPRILKGGARCLSRVRFVSECGWCFWGPRRVQGCADHAPGLTLVPVATPTPKPTIPATAVAVGNPTPPLDGQSTATPSPTPTPPCVPPPPGLVAWWPMDGNPLDLWASHNPSATNAITFVAGMVGPGVTFGAGGYIDIPHSAALANQQFTIDAWVKPQRRAPGAGIEQRLLGQPSSCRRACRRRRDTRTSRSRLRWSDQYNSTSSFTFGNMTTWSGSPPAPTFPPGTVVLRRGDLRRQHLQALRQRRA